MVNHPRVDYYRMECRILKTADSKYYVDSRVKALGGCQTPDSRLHMNFFETTFGIMILGANPQYIHKKTIAARLFWTV